MREVARKLANTLGKTPQIVALPIGLARATAVLSENPNYYDEVLDHPYFIPCCIAVGVFLTANLIVMRRMVNIRV